MAHFYRVKMMTPAPAGRTEISTWAVGKDGQPQNFDSRKEADREAARLKEFCRPHVEVVVQEVTME